MTAAVRLALAATLLSALAACATGGDGDGMPVGDFPVGGDRPEDASASENSDATNG